MYGKHEIADGTIGSQFTIDRLRTLSFQCKIASMAQGCSSINRAVCITIALVLTSCGAQKSENVSNATESTVTARGITYQIISGKDLRNTIAEHNLVEIPTVHDTTYRQYYNNGIAIRDCNGTCSGIWMIDENRLCEQYNNDTKMQCFYILKRDGRYYQSYKLDKVEDYITRIDITPINYNYAR
ncbi:hypothetical protein J2W40_000574 [Sphingobium xenophagum]|uniref:Lipoprotein n=1 Tax=Sphingobium xenophagum TaxID=121428 RepID=A0ABU1WWU3_SPHXE|nr:hypothetical protein [Sphingobium xenophagum]MDR7153777.1 hypothetical protein [Sphingobium xenophagum]